MGKDDQAGRRTTVRLGDKTDRQTGERDRDMQAVNGVQRRVDAQGQLLLNPLFGCPSPPRPQLSFNTKLLIIENR